MLPGENEIQYKSSIKCTSPSSWINIFFPCYFEAQTKSLSTLSVQPTTTLKAKSSTKVSSAAPLILLEIHRILVFLFLFFFGYLALIFLNPIPLKIKNKKKGQQQMVCQNYIYLH